jgi:hypothetical protein
MGLAPRALLAAPPVAPRDAGQRPCSPGLRAGERCKQKPPLSGFPGAGASCAFAKTGRKYTTAPRLGLVRLGVTGAGESRDSQASNFQQVINVLFRQPPQYRRLPAGRGGHLYRWLPAGRGGAPVPPASSRQGRGTCTAGFQPAGAGHLYRRLPAGRGGVAGLARGGAPSANRRMNASSIAEKQ